VAVTRNEYVSNRNQVIVADTVLKRLLLFFHDPERVAKSVVYMVVYCCFCVVFT